GSGGRGRRGRSGPPPVGSVLGGHPRQTALAVDVVAGLLAEGHQGAQVVRVEGPRVAVLARAVLVAALECHRVIPRRGAPDLVVAGPDAGTHVALRQRREGPPLLRGGCRRGGGVLRPRAGNVR